MEMFRISMFWVGIVGTVLAGGIGLAGVWIPNFWKNETSGKLLLTDGIITITAITTCVILNWIAH